MSSLPSTITSIAYHASNGELAWRRADIPAAVGAISACGMAILGGEVWVALGNGRWDGCVPSRDGLPDGVWGWDTNPRAEGESWAVYCERTAAESVQVVDSMTVEQEAHPSVVDRLWFNLCYITEAEGQENSPIWPPMDGL